MIPKTTWVVDQSILVVGKHPTQNDVVFTAENLKAQADRDPEHLHFDEAAGALLYSGPVTDIRERPPLSRCARHGLRLEWNRKTKCLFCVTRLPKSPELLEAMKVHEYGQHPSSLDVSVMLFDPRESCVQCKGVTNGR